MNKVYASEGEPCCSKCVSPVFNNKWSPTKLFPSSLPNSTGSKTASLGGHSGNKMSSIILSPSPSTDSGVSETASVDGNTDEVIGTLNFNNSY